MEVCLMMPQTSEVFWCIFWPEMMSLLTPGSRPRRQLARAGAALPSFSPPASPAVATGRSLNLKFWQLSFVLVLIWAGSRVLADLSVSDRVKEVQGWVWRECGDPAAAANWATCATCQVWWLEKTFLLFGIIIKPLNASVLENFKLSQKILAPTDTKTRREHCTVILSSLNSWIRYAKAFIFSKSWTSKSSPPSLLVDYEYWIMSH